MEVLAEALGLEELALTDAGADVSSIFRFFNMNTILMMMDRSWSKL